MSRYVFFNIDAQDATVLTAAKKTARSPRRDGGEVAGRQDAAGGDAGAGARGRPGLAGLALLGRAQDDPGDRAQALGRSKARGAEAAAAKG